MLTLAFNIESVSAIVPEYPAIYVDPAETIDPTLVPGTNFTVAIKTDYIGDDVFGWQFTLSFNPSVLNAIEVVDGDLMDPVGAFIPGTINNTEGTISLSLNFIIWWMFPPILTSGPGTLANVTFTVVGYGCSDLILGPETGLAGVTDGGWGDFYWIIDGETMPDHLGPGYFCNVGPNVPPVAVISAPTSACIGESVTFDGTGSYDPDGTIVSYSWDFGDASTGMGATVEHVYAIVGTYSVTLTVTDNNGLTDTATHTITIGALCIGPLVADLVKWKVKPEAHHWSYEKDADKLVTLTALARNLGTVPVDVEITFFILDGRDGTSIYTTAVTTTLTVPGEDVPITVDIDPITDLGWDEMTKLVAFPHVTLRYDSDGDGTYDVPASTKTVRFAVVP